MKLYIGNQNYSSWSLRPWLLLTAHNVEFEQQVISLHDDGMHARLLEISAAAKVPVLVDGEFGAVVGGTGEKPAKLDKPAKPAKKPKKPKPIKDVGQGNLFD